MTIDMNRLKVVDFIDTGIRPVNTTIIGERDHAAHRPEAARRPPARRPELHARRPRRLVAGVALPGRLEAARGRRPRPHRLRAERRRAPDHLPHVADEIYVPYAIPDPNWSWRGAFDVGEYNLGQYTERSRPNVDVPENAVFFDEVAPATRAARAARTSSARGRACTSGTGGSLWDRTDPDDVRARRPLRARARRHVRRTPIGNYTYARRVRLQAGRRASTSTSARRARR